MGSGPQSRSVNADALPALLSDDAPATVAALHARTRTLAGQTLGAIADALGRELPPDLKRHKGKAGELIERALGVPRSSRPGPDLEVLGIEIKTVPVGNDGQPHASTYVCRVDARGLKDATWATSRVKKKLAHVLFVPVLAEKRVPLAERCVGQALLWQPSDDEETLLRADWEDLTDLMLKGGPDAVTARRGHVLQVRPKAARAAVKGHARDVDGELYQTVPRGFYLRRAFVASVLSAGYHPSSPPGPAPKAAEEQP
jgi:DNA mismatch repair protein MutH